MKKKKIISLILSIIVFIFLCTGYFIYVNYLKNDDSGDDNDIELVKEYSDNKFSKSTIDFTTTTSSNYVIDYDYYKTPYNKESITYNVSDYYNGYYNSIVSWTNGEDLKNQLNALINGNGYKPLNFSTGTANWETNTFADRSLTNYDFVDAVYTNTDLYNSSTWDREHAWCASLMTGSNTSDAVSMLGRATDFHNLFASDSSANRSRGNKNYAFVDPTSSGYKVVKDSSNNILYEYNDTCFEPGDNDKGRLARAIFYMATMYMDEIEDTKNNITMKPLTIKEGHVNYVSGNNCDFSIGHLNDLLVWATYNVDREEMQHNEMVYGHINSYLDYAQGNRNPYVDYPELVDYVFGTKKDQAGSLNTLVPSYYYLNLDSDNTYCYQVDPAKYTYKENEALNKTNDFKVYAIGKSINDYQTSIYKRTEINEYSIDGMDENNKFSNVGINTITINLSTKSISYTILHKNQYLQDSSFSCDFKKENITTSILKREDNSDGTIKLNGTSWIASVSKNPSVGSLTQKGLQIGTATNPIESFTLESKNIFNCDDKSHINSIYLKIGVASGKTYKVKISILDNNNNIIKSEEFDVTYNKDNDTELISYTNIGSVQGKIKIDITNVDKALYIHSLGVDLT